MPRAALGLALGPAVALGLARFSYALLLPGMRADLGWSFAQAGTMNTANALGYLAGALVAAPVSHRTGPRVAFGASMALTAGALLLTSTVSAFGLLVALRVAAGMAGAVTFVVGATLAARLASGGSHGHAASVLSVYTAGAGVGTAVAGLVVPSLLDSAGASGWRLGWIAFGVLSALATLVAIPAARSIALRPHEAPASAGRWRPGPIAVALGGYALFGAGYIGYITFIVAFLKAQGATVAEISAFWTVLGLAAVASAFAWGRVIGRLRGGRGVALSTAIVGAGAVLPLLADSLPLAFASAVVFGGAFLAVPSAATAFARQAHPPHHWTIGISALTVAFAVGQCLGPVLAGSLSDGPGGVRAGLVLSAAILALGALIAAAQPHRDGSVTA